MLFNSVVFLYFLVTVFVLYWFVFSKNLRYQNVLLLVSSYFFYGWWDWRFLSLILFSSLLDYFISLQIASSTGAKVRYRFLLLSLVANLGLLGFFKYFNFFSTSFAASMQLLGWEVDAVTLNLILPVGISFYTFQSMSYTLDVYRKQLEPTRDVVSFLTYVSFFPQLVAGPIERALHLLPQVEQPRRFNEASFREGFLQIGMGFFRKMVIADNLAVYVDSIYANSEIHSGSTLLLATLFYAFQIYFDFSGYSDIAIGTAKLFGFRFHLNFNLPYFSKSLTEFWRRWHISLSFWLRDYLYISLGGNRKGIRITYRNLLLTMLLGGLWHGSSWNFVIWGGIHGLVLSIEKYLFTKYSLRDFGLFGWFYTFAVVLVAWVFFRATSFDAAVHIVGQLFSLNYGVPYIGDINVMINAISMLFMGLVFDRYLYRSGFTLEELGSRISVVALVLLLTLLGLLLLLFYSSSTNFIYFQF